MEKQNEGINILNGSYAVKAIYTDQGLAEYNTNPLTQALPPSILKKILSIRQRFTRPLSLRKKLGCQVQISLC